MVFLTVAARGSCYAENWRWRSRGCVSMAVRWLMAVSCVACAVIESNEATDTPPHLVYTSGSSIYRVNTDGTSQTLILNSSGAVNKLGIDFDYRNGRLFWADSTQRRIMASRLDGSQIEAISSNNFDRLERLAYDWTTDKVYWSDYGRAEIGLVDLRTKVKIVVLVTGPWQQSRPRGLALDTMRRNMYWTDWLDQNGRAVIEKASMDGRNREIIVNTTLSQPYDLTLDIASNKLYFIDAYYDVISVVNTDGSNRQRLFSFVSNVVPFSLTFHDNVLYWTERRVKLISRLELSEGERQAVNVSVLGVRPAGLVVVARDSQPEVTNPCLDSGCSHICILSSASTRGYTCACEEGIDLLPDQLTCKGSASTVVPTTISTLSPSTSGSCPCVNGGECKEERGSEYTCLCPTDYTGPLCEKHINNSGVCDLAINRIDPLCKNGGTCVNTGVYEYDCVCVHGYEGRYCEKRINYGVCNESKPCYNGGVCLNKEESPGFSCECRKGFSGDNCTFGQLQGNDPAITSAVFVGVIAGFLMVVGVLVLVIVCVFAMLKRQKEKNKALEESAMSSRSNSPMIKSKRNLYRSEETPSSTDTASHDYWSASQPSIVRGNTNLYSQGPRRGVPPNLRTYAKAESFDQLSRESKVLTV